MTTNNIKNEQDLKKFGTYLRNKWNVYLTRNNEDLLERAILKTTSSKNKCPNEKHMERLLLYTYDLGAILMEYSRSGPYGHPKDTRSLFETNAIIIDRLEKRLHTHEWNVVLKALIVFHRLMKDGGSGFQQALGMRKGVFSISNMKDLSDRYYGRSLNRFVRKYALCLEERVSITNAISVEAKTLCNMEDLSKWRMYVLCRGRDVLSVIDHLLNQVQSVLSVPVYPGTIDNPVVALAWMFLSQDAKRLIHLLSDCIMYWIDNAETVSAGERSSLVQAIEGYNSAIEGVRMLLSKLHRISPVFAPPTMLRTVPTERLRGLLQE